LLRVNKGGVTDPLLIRFVGTKGSIQNVFSIASGITSNLSLFMSNRGAGVNTVLLHQPGHLVQADLNAFWVKVMIDSWRTIGFSTGFMGLNYML